MTFRIYWGWVVCFFVLILITLSAGVTFSFNELAIHLEDKYVDSNMTLLGNHFKTDSFSNEVRN